ncbi:Valyl/Leucyl/Isoleucyl-tRNA synthetase [Xylariaceae sp. FL1651]|nr:Valyl/Leucyl/Isoleucyl-tRNA synthetase [Xylariaceae sp. FL1651]
MPVLKWADDAKSVANALPATAKVYFVAATLRPETMYGQTYCFVGPNITYGIFHGSDNDDYLVSSRSARNTACQNIFTEWGVFSQVAEVSGKQVIGTLVEAPLSFHKAGIRNLPMETVTETKGTGIVTSVPSDSLDDYATITDLTNKPDYYGIQKGIGGARGRSYNRNTGIWRFNRSNPGPETQGPISQRPQVRRAQGHRLQGGILQ